MSDTSHIGLIIFVGAQGPSPVERMIEAAHRAIARDTIDKALAIGLCAPMIISTNSPEMIADLAGLPVIVEPDTHPFHFGQTLQTLIQKYDLRHVFYTGGGSSALISQEQLAGICRMILDAPAGVLANNMISADFVAFTPGNAIEQIELPNIDNTLARLLHRQAGLPSIKLERTPATQFDVDTPTDLQILQLHPSKSPHIAAYLDTLSFDVSRLRSAMRVFIDSSKEMLVAGRVGSQIWANLDTDTACRKRIYSEERGMRSSGRDERGEVQSLLGEYLRLTGPRGFFESIARMCNAAFLDTRVLFQHARLDLSAADRFYSDLLMPEKIHDPWVREFTAAARDASVPAILGGHSLVSGGLWTLIDAAWLERDKEREAERALQAITRW